MANSSKGWKTRKANAKKKVAKKRGVKPGTKRGRYRKQQYALNELLSERSVLEVAPSLSLVETLDAAITRLEVAVGNSIDRINSLVGKF